MDVWRHPECLALPPLAAPAASVPDLQKMEDDDHERGFFRGVVGPRTKKPRGRVKRIRRYRTEDPTSWLQFVQPQWWLAAERLRVWLMENLKGANADRSTLDALVQNGALAVLLTGLLVRTFDDSDVARSFAIRVYGDIPGCLEALIAVGASAVPDR